MSSKINYTKISNSQHRSDISHFSFFPWVCSAAAMWALVALLVVWLAAPWLVTPCAYSVNPVHKRTDAIIRTIAFGSCASTHDGLAIFNDISADVLVFLGDNVYADTLRVFYMKWMYNRLSCTPEFRNMVNRVKYVLAIWDDHDYGSDDMGAENPFKYESQDIFLDFWRIPTYSERRRGRGVYGSYQFNMSHNQTLSIIMPDLRFFRDPLTICQNGEYYPRKDCFCPSNGSMIGEEQWAWLEDTVKASQRVDALSVIASSIQFAHSANGLESWTNFPRDRARMQSLLNPSKSLVISGDLHYGEISLWDGILDITSSGFSSVAKTVLPNKNRIGNAFPQNNYGVIDLTSQTVSLYGRGQERLYSIEIPQI